MTHKIIRHPIFKSPYLWAILIRLVFMVLVPIALQGDAVDYIQMARNLAAGHGFSRCYSEPFVATAQRPPLYPLALALMYLIGLGSEFGAVLLNMICDLVSMRLARMWGDELKLTWAKKIPWVIGLCPLLITYGMYPTTENMSITLFFLALVLTYRTRPLQAGLAWGLLSLCRSYFLLFPIVLGIFGPTRRGPRSWKRGPLTILIVASFIAPTCWMVRNKIVLNRIAFTQTSMVGWQTNQGLCYANFDWWNPAQVEKLVSDPVMQRIMSSHCSSESEIAGFDSQAKAEVYKCVTEHPLATVRNVLTKGVHLFINWGLFMPYNRVPFIIQQIINAFLLLYWLCVIRILFTHRQKGGGLQDAVHFSLLNIGYIFLVTLPFAVDARYLLGPFLTLLIAILEMVQTPVGIFRAGLKKGT